MLYHQLRGLFAAGIAAAAFCGAPALAADMPVKADPLFNWTGWYLGLNTGYSWGKSKYTVTSGGAVIGTTSVKHDGWLGSGEGGYCWQQVGSTTVACIEARYDFPREKGRGSFTPPGVTIDTTPQIDPFLIGPHLGFLTDSNKMFWYAAGGLAVGNLAFDSNISLGGTAHADKWKAGWFIGAGIERMIDRHWSWKLEYDYVRFSTGNITATFVPASTAIAAPQTISMGRAFDNVITFGINYHFGTH